MLINLFQTIRSSGVPCTVRELLDLLGALENQLVYANIDDFYYLSRATLVKDEKYYDKFDKAFEIYFKGIERMEDVFQALIPEDWLRKAFEKELDPEELKKIKSLGGLEKPTSGKIIFNYQEITGLSEDEVSDIRKKNIGIIFQSFYLNPNYTAVENVALTLELNNFKNPEKEAKILLDRFGLKHRFNNLPSQLSGGEQQRVAIARAIAMKPELILADEPTGNLDTENSIMITNILFKYVKEEGSSLIMVTHDPKLADKAKRKIKIKDGKIK